MSQTKTYWYHLIAILTVIIWGVTFVSTKILIGQGLTASEIFFYRFILAYIGIWMVCPRTIFARTAKDELLCAGAGLCGGSMYFILENTALGITLASNVSLIICTAPLFTAFLSYLFSRKNKLKRNLIYGSLIAFVGVALVIFNGSFVLQINPLGDILTILAALSWAFYGIILRQLNNRYPTLFITRKVFFYGIITILPMFIFNPLTTPIQIMLSSLVVSNILFLGIVASLLCYIMWNTAVKQLGVIEASNYIYFVPMVTLLTSAMVIDEKITGIAIIGSVFILCGVYIAEKGLKLPTKK